MNRLRSIVGNGQFFLVVTACALAVAGAFAMFLGASGRFLPHDERYLGMTAHELCQLHECRIVHFMVHDRISFGGALVAIGILYGWLALGPLRRGEEWAWWTLLISGVLGFSSFFAYLGYGYLDTWHGAATLALLPCFVLGMSLVGIAPSERRGPRSLLAVPANVPWTSRGGLGRASLLVAAAGIFAGGFVICLVGTTIVFVPQDIVYLGVSGPELHAINARLVPLIAHDRAGFGGALCCCGFTLFFCIAHGRPTPILWRVLASTGTVGFGAAIGVHPAIGYNDAVHLAPAVVGAAAYVIGLILTHRTYTHGFIREDDR